MTTPVYRHREEVRVSGAISGDLENLGMTGVFARLYSQPRGGNSILSLTAQALSGSTYVVYFDTAALPAPSGEVGARYYIDIEIQRGAAPPILSPRLEFRLTP